MAFLRSLKIALLFAALGTPASGQDLKPWKHGVIEPKGDAGFMVMVGQRDFASKHGLKIEIVPLKNGATAHKALLQGSSTASNQAQARRFSLAHTAPISRF